MDLYNLLPRTSNGEGNNNYQRGILSSQGNLDQSYEKTRPLLLNGHLNNCNSRIKQIEYLKVKTGRFFFLIRDNS